MCRTHEFAGPVLAHLPCGSLGDQDSPPDFLDILGDDCATEGAQSVHPIGNPISHSTHVGFRAPPAPDVTVSFNGREFRVIVSRLAFEDFQSRDVGVGHRPSATSTAPRSVVPPVWPGVGSQATWASLLQVCVGQSLFATASSMRPRGFRGGNFSEFTAPSLDLMVGHNPDAFALVRGINTDSRNSERLAGVVACFQVRKHIVERHLDDASNVLTNDPSGPALADDAAHLRPEVAVIRLASTLPGDAEGLAGEAARDDVHMSNCCA